MGVKKIQNFIAQLAQREEESVIGLYHVNVAGKRTPVWFNDKWTITTDTAELAATIYEEGRNNAGALGGLQRYLVAAFRKDDTERQDPLSTVGFMAQPDMAGEGDSALSEPATPDGLLAQLMRHNQEMFRMHNGMMGALTTHLAQTIDRLSSQNEKLVTEKMTAIITMEDLMSKKHERDITMKREEQKSLRSNDMYERVMQLLPIAVNKLAGKEIMRQKDTMLEAVAVQFMQTMTPTQLDTIAQSGMFNQQQLLLISTLLEQVSKRMVTADEMQKSNADAKEAVTNNLK